MNGPSSNFTFWNSYLRFEYEFNTSTIQADYQPVVIGYHTEGNISHQNSVSFTDKITDFIKCMYFLLKTTQHLVLFISISKFNDANIFSKFESIESM